MKVARPNLRFGSAAGRSAGAAGRGERKRVPGIRRSDRPPIRPVEYVLVSDIDNTLLGERDGLRVLLRWLRRSRARVAFGVATGRVLPLALSVLEEWEVPVPDVLITGVGSEVTWGDGLSRDAGWTEHLRDGWRRDEVEEALGPLPGLVRQPEAQQGEHKVSYDRDAAVAPPVNRIARLLQSRGLNVRLVYSHDRHLDVLPARASKGLAIRYLAARLDLPVRRFLVAGDSGNDVEMLVEDTLGVVVGNHSLELEPLRGLDQIYFARAPSARGILEGIRHYGFAARAGRARSSGRRDSASGGDRSK